MNAFKVGEHLFFTAVAHAPLFFLPAVEGHHQIVLLAAAQRIMHQVAVRTRPQHRRVNAQIVRHIGGVDHRAIDYMAGHPRRIAQQALAYNRLTAVAADQDIRRPAVAFVIENRHVIGGLADIHHLGRGAILHGRMGQRRFPNGGVDVYPVDHRIRPAKMVAERLSGLNMHHLFAAYRIHHGDMVGKDRPLAGDCADAEAVQRRERVRAKLDPGADFADFMRLFQQHHFDALARQRERRGRSANTTADNNCSHHFCHVAS